MSLAEWRARLADRQRTERKEESTERRAVEVEREACAKIADQELMRRGASYEESLSAREIAAAIRARSNVIK